jgi:Glycosyl transferase 4-like domain
MRRVLIVSPHFPPVNAPDMHRVRQSLPYFQEFGWKPVVFAVTPDDVEAARDDLQERTLPQDTEVHHVRALPAGLTRKVGLGNLGIRCYLALARAVDRYLSEHPVDLVYFSTTVFVSMALGPRWKRKFGVPFVLDLQDPWRNDFHLKTPPSQRPRKFWFDYRLNHWLEARTVPQAAGIISVSPAYPDELRQRYPGMKDMRFLILPFSALPRDHEIANSPEISNHLFAPDPDLITMVNTGALPPNMAYSLGALFGAVRKGLKRDPLRFSRLRFYFVGTSYAPPERAEKMTAVLARHYGVEHLVHEQVAREPYFTSLRLLRDADLLLIPGNTDPGYTASKLFPYILANKPILALVNERSTVNDILIKTRAGEVVSFKCDEDPLVYSDKILSALDQILQKLPYQPATDWDEFEPYTARNMTKKQCEFFDQVNGQ